MWSLHSENMWAHKINIKPCFFYKTCNIHWFLITSMCFKLFIFHSIGWLEIAEADDLPVPYTALRSWETRADWASARQIRDRAYKAVNGILASMHNRGWLFTQTYKRKKLWYIWQFPGKSIQTKDLWPASAKSCFVLKPNCLFSNNHTYIAVKKNELLRFRFTTTCIWKS